MAGNKSREGGAGTSHISHTSAASESQPFVSSTLSLVSVTLSEKVLGHK